MKNTDSCKVKPNQCGIKFPEVKFRTDQKRSGEEEEFIGNITYVGCEEAEKIYNQEAGNLMDINHLTIGVLSGVIAVLLLANITYFSVKKCKNKTESQVIHHKKAIEEHRVPLVCGIKSRLHLG